MAKRSGKQKPGTLWLLFCGIGEEPTTLGLISPTEKKVYNENKNVLGDVFGGVYEHKMITLGSTQGWIGIYDDGTKPCSPKLFNPFSRDQIQLPPLNSRVGRLFLSSDPCLTKDYTVVVLHGSDDEEGARMSFYKPGDDNTWTCSVTSLEDYYHDIICINDKIFGLSRTSRKLHVWDFSSVPTEVAIPKKVVDVENFQWCPVGIAEGCFIYLVESVEEILIAQRIVLEHDRYACTTIRFNVFKLDSSKKKWIRIQALPSGRAILIKESGGSNICVSIEDFPVLEENSIYFKEDYCFGVYNMNEKKVRLLEDGQWDPARCDPILVVRKPWL